MKYKLNMKNDNNKQYINNKQNNKIITMNYYPKDDPFLPNLHITFHPQHIPSLYSSSIPSFTALPSSTGT